MLFSEEGIGKVRGLFSIDHLIFSLSGMIVLIILLLIFRKSTKEKVEKLIIANFAILFVLEILKIIWNLVVRTEVGLHQWVPLYFCSLFIYASGLFTVGYFLKNEKLKNIGLSWIVYGQIIAGMAFIIYPTSSVGLNPLLHIMTIHSFIFHVLTCFIGLLIIITGYYHLKLRDFKLYFISILICSVLVYVFNIIFKTNLMFINEPWSLKPLEWSYAISPYLYTCIVVIGQIVGTFFGSYVIYLLVNKIKEKERWWRLKEVNHIEG